MLPPEIMERMSDFHRCPNTGRIIDSCKHDDKAICNCGETNPQLAINGTREAPGTHLKRFLATAPVEEYILQEQARRAG